MAARRDVNSAGGSDAQEEIAALMATLRATEKRLLELTGGDVAAGAAPEGAAHLLRQAQTQDRLGHLYLAEQTAILDAVPAHIAVIDAKGVILSVNEAWRQFANASASAGASAKALRRPGDTVGVNYLEICDRARGKGAADAREVAKGIRAVLGGARDFSFEYACHSPTERRWFLMRVTPLDPAAPRGAVVMHMDITERKLAEDAMRTSEISMATAQSLAHFGSWEFDLVKSDETEGGRLRWSDEMFRIAGYEPGAVEVSNAFFYRLVHPDDREPVRQALAAAIRERKQYSIVHRLIRADGKERILHETAQIFFDETNARPLKIVGTAHDITDYRRAEEALQRSEQQQRELAQQLDLEKQRLVEAQAVAKVGSWETDLITMEVSWSEQTHRIFETDPQAFEATHERFLQFVHPDDRMAVDAAFHQSQGHRAAFAMEHRVLLPDGRIKFVEERWQAAFDDEGNAVRVLGTCQDITERKQAEEALRESEERFRGTFEQAAVGIAHVSTEGRFLRVNDKLCSIIGYGRAELLKMTFLELTLPEDFGAGQQARLAMLAGTQSSFTSEKRYRSKSGALVWVNLVTTLERTKAGAPKYFISIFEDITSRKLMEEDLHRSQALLRMAGRLSRMGPWSLDLSVGRVVWSEEVCAIHEAPPGTSPTLEEALDWFSPESREVVTRALETCTRDGTPYDLELEIITRTGRRIWVRSICEAERDGSGVIRRVQGNLQDIHHLKQAELKVSRANDELRDSEEKFRQLADNITDVFWMTSPDSSTVHFVSAGYELIWGRTTESLYARPGQWLDSIVPEDRARITALFATLMEGAPKVRAEYRISRPDGTVRWIHDHGFQVRDAAGHLVRLTGIARDITERKQAEEELQKQRTELRVLFDLMPAMVWFKDTQNGILRVNKRVAEMAGRPLEDIEGSPAHEIYPADAARFYEDDLQVIRSGEPKLGIVERMQVPGAEDLWLQTDKVPYCDKDGKVIGIVVMSQDVTERKRAEQHMAEQAALIDESRDAISVSDLDRRITFWSKGAERLYGWTAGEAKGRSVHELLRVDADRFQTADRTVRETGEWNGEIQKTARGGTVLTVDGRWTLMRDAQGLPHSILSVDTDVTERKKIEKQFLRSQRMESIGTLAGGIAHDLNNVLAPILMGVDYLKAKYPEASGILDRFENSANRGAGMVRQLLTFAKGAEGERISIQLTHLVMEIKALMQGTFPKNIELVVSCDPALPTVLGDATQLHQILLNLCVNARDAMPSGGTLTVEAQVVQVDALYAAAVPDAKAGTYVALRVRDTGTGIPPEVLDRIFDPFFSTKGPDKGTGLGLSTVMGIVKGLGGFLQVASTPGQGSTFAVHLPVEIAGGVTTASAPVGPGARGRGETVLLVDDEPGVLEVGTLVLRGLNYKAVTAVDGAEGLVKLVLHKHEIRVIITDMHMPHMDGLAFVHAVRRVLPDVPIIMGSGRLDDSVAEELKHLGVHDRLDKPYTQQMLGAMLAKLVAGTETSGGG